jgi:hypothetical protein
MTDEKSQTVVVPPGRCVVCQTPVFYNPASESSGPGHIWTGKGLMEFHQSRTCQTCTEGLYYPPAEFTMTVIEEGGKPVVPIQHEPGTGIL